MKHLEPFAFGTIIALVALGLMGLACFAFPLQPPLARYAISSGVGYRLKPLGGGDSALHRGVDLVGPPGCAILAAAPGVVVEHWPAPGGKWRGHPVFGGYVVIDHGGGILTLYGHMSATYVHSGQRVSTGQIIGRQGATGDATGAHLHWELIVSPMLFLSPPLGPVLRDPRELLR